MKFINLGQVHIWFRTSADAMLLVRRTSASQISRLPLGVIFCGISLAILDVVWCNFDWLHWPFWMTPANQRKHFPNKSEIFQPCFLRQNELHQPELGSLSFLLPASQPACLPAPTVPSLPTWPRYTERSAGDNELVSPSSSGVPWPATW